MFAIGDSILMQDPKASDRLLRRSTVIVASGLDEEVDPAATFTIVLEASALEVAPGDDLLVYFYRPLPGGLREFVQQAVRVLEAAETDPCVTLELVPVGEPSAAEARQAHRVMTLSADLLVRVGEQRSLPVEDLSATGFAVVAGGDHRIGETLPVSMAFGGDIYSGTAVVQSVREIAPGLYRYGIRAEDDGSDLIDGLEQISISVQRDQAKTPGAG